MATEQQVISHLQAILKDADLETVTEEVLKGQLTSHFSEDMTRHEEAIMTEVERFIRAQAQLEAKGRKREQENVEPLSGKAKQVKTSAPAPTEPGMFVLSPDGLQRCVIKEFKGQTYVDIRAYWTKGDDFNPTKKGLMMNPAEWAVLEAALPNLQGALNSSNTSFTVNLSQFRRATIFEKGKLSVDIREWYGTDEGGLKPGQKGIALSQDAFQALQDAAAAITAQLGSAAKSAAAPMLQGNTCDAPTARPSAPVEGGATTAADGTKLWKLGTTGLKHASVGEFKGTKNIGLREYYEKDGLRPGKKGINLSVDQFTNLVNNAEAISKALEAKDQSVSIELGPNRHVRLNEFKSNLLVDVREFYQSGDGMKPGNKGLSMTAAQWSGLAAVLPELQSALQN